MYVIEEIQDYSELNVASESELISAHINRVPEHRILVLLKINLVY